MSIALVLSLLLAATPAEAVDDARPTIPEHDRCAFAAEDRQWLEDALDGWRTVSRDFLRAPEQRLPQIVTYDKRCSYALESRADSAPQWSISEHGGEISLPNGGKIPPAPIAVNAATDAGDNFVVMSLPSIWRPVAPKSEIPLEWFLEGILFHELAHAYQSAVAPETSFPALLKRLSLPDNVSDDSVQDAFKANADYVRAYEAERDLLFRAASAPTDNEARALACEAVDKLRARRERHFSGSNAHWALVDELSLTTEGLGEWVSYKWLTSARGLPSSLVLPKFRGAYWSQEQGLATFLVVDRLVPEWQKRLFDRSPATAEDLLALSCGRTKTGRGSRAD